MIAIEVKDSSEVQVDHDAYGGVTLRFPGLPPIRMHQIQADALAGVIAARASASAWDSWMDNGIEAKDGLKPIPQPEAVDSIG